MPLEVLADAIPIHSACLMAGTRSVVEVSRRDKTTAPLCEASGDNGTRGFGSKRDLLSSCWGYEALKGIDECMALSLSGILDASPVHAPVCCSVLSCPVLSCPVLSCIPAV